MSENTKRLDAIDARLAKAAPGAITITPSDVAFLLDLARKQQVKLDAVESLAIGWTLRGESDMAFSKTLPDPDIADAILTNGAQMVENARHIRTALDDRT